MERFVYTCCAALAVLYISEVCGSTAKAADNTQQKSQKETDIVTKEYDGIVATVNGSIITKRDLDDRINLALFFVGGNISTAQKAELSEEVLSEMIAEYVKKQCADRNSPGGVCRIGKKEVWETFCETARRNQKSPKEFCKLLADNNVKEQTFLEQITNNLCWVEYVRAAFARNVNISESELNRAFSDTTDKFTKESFYVCRMFFPVARSSEENSVQAQANNVLRMLQHGASFSGIARQFSKSADANNGGDLGWVFRGQLSDTEMQALSQMEIGSYRIVRNARGFVLLFLKDKKEAGLRSFTEVKFYQAGVGFSTESPPEEAVRELQARICEMKRSSGSYRDFLNKAKTSGIMSVSEEMSATPESMQPKFRSIMTNLPAGGISDPVLVPGGMVVFCIADKKTHTINPPTKEEIKAQKINERLSVLAARELQDLMRKAYVKLNTKYSHVKLLR